MLTPLTPRAWCSGGHKVPDDCATCQAGKGKREIIGHCRCCQNVNAGRPRERMLHAEHHALGSEVFVSEDRFVSCQRAAGDVDNPTRANRSAGRPNGALRGPILDIRDPRYWNVRVFVDD